MTLASDAMKGLQKAEKGVNEKKTTTTPPKDQKPVKTAGNGSQDKKVELSDDAKKLLALKTFIETNNLGLDDNGKKYVKVEVWQYLAQQRGLIPTFLSEETQYGENYGVKTTCILHNASGLEITRSTMIATRDEEFLKDKDRFAVMGLSETRAFARAVKNIYGYLLVALGFNATPWEEITIKKK